MIKIVDTELFEQPVVAVIDEGYSPPRILTLRKGTFRDEHGYHEANSATFHAKKIGQKEIPYVSLIDSVEEPKQLVTLH